MPMKRHFFLLITSILLLTAPSSIVAATQPLTADNPLAIHYELNRIEDYLEEKYDKKFKGNWDFNIIYHDEQIDIRMEYDTKAKKQLLKTSNEDLKSFIDPVITKITRTMKRDMPISGILIEEDCHVATYTFMYKDGNLDIK